MSSIGSPNPLLFGGATSYEIKRSLRFNSADSALLTHTPSGDGNRKKFTFSFWVKKALGTTSSTQALFSAWTGSGTDRMTIFAGGSLQLEINPNKGEWRTTRLLRDPSSWYHIVCAFDTTQAAVADRMKLYINNEGPITTFDVNSGSNLTQDYEITGWNKGSQIQHIGSYAGADNSTGSSWFDGYMADFYFIDNQQLTPASFGETNEDTGQWVPIKYSGTYNSNSYFLNFKDNSNTTAATLGKDSSGNGNNWTPHNFSVAEGVGNDSVEDTPTNNFCTLNTLGSGIDGSGCDISQGGLYVARNSGSNRFMDSTFTLSSGKWYWEAKTGSSISDYPRIGIWNRGSYQNRLNYPGEGSSNDDQVRGWGANGTSFGASGDSASGLPTFSTNDVLMFALDMDNGKIWFGKNGTWYTNDNSTTTTASAIAGGTATPKFADLKTGAESQFRQSEKGWTPIVHMNSGDTWEFNFGSRPFAHTPPAGFKSICTKNLPEPAVIKPSDYFKTVLYTGQNTSNQGLYPITTVGFQPDLVWGKAISSTIGHIVFDSVRGEDKQLEADLPDAEVVRSSAAYRFLSNGFSVSTVGNMNNPLDYVAWCWKESATAGFDIVTYTGDGSDGTSINHSLGVKPDLIAVKRRDGTGHWVTECPHTHNGRGMHWDLDNGSWNAGTNTITLNASNFTFANSGDSNRKVNFNGETYVAYLWASIPGFSKIYGYSGNGNADGEFIYTGFRPAYVVYKATDEAYWWIIHDTERDPYNVVKRRSWINENNAENSSGAYADFCANGIKFRTSDAGNNSTNINHIVIAFAAQTLKYANAH